MVEEQFEKGADKIMLNRSSSGRNGTSLPGKRSASSRPRVLVVGPGPKQVGGVTTFIRILMTSRLVAEKYDLIHLDTTREEDDISSAGRFSLRNLTYFLSQAIQLILVAIRKHPRVMHLAVTSGWSFWKGSTFLLIGKMFGMSTVAHIHGGSMRNYYFKQPLYVRHLISWLLQQADVVIALSEQWKRFFLDEVRPDLNVVVVPNTVDTLFVEALEQDDYTSRQSGNVVLFVGHLAQAKGVFDILRAVPIVLASRQDVVFLFAGRAPEPRILEEMETYSAQTQLGNSIQFLGEITGPAKLDLFRRATLFILPSYGEGLPYALLEAMAVGLPVITTPVGAIPEIIKDGQQGFLITPGDHEALARHILQLIGDESLRQEMSLANRQLIRDFYLPDAAMAQLVAIYDGLHGISSTEILGPSSNESKDKQEFSKSKNLTNSSLLMNDEYDEESHAS